MKGLTHLSRMTLAFCQGKKPKDLIKNLQKIKLGFLSENTDDSEFYQTIQTSPTLPG